MAGKSAPEVLVTTRASWNAFSCAILCMVPAGTVYWFAALGPGMQARLNLSSWEVTMVLTIVSCGSPLGLVTGPIYNQLGGRLTTIVGAALTSAPYLFIAALMQARAQGAFAVTALASVIVDMGGFIVYAAQMASAAVAFPRDRRGRVMGFLSAVYAMSAGICGMFQSAFFPNVADAERLVLFVAAFVASPIVISLLLSPRTPPAGDAAEEHVPLLPDHGSRAESVVHGKGTDEILTKLAFGMAIVLVVVLQFGAYATWAQLPAITFGGAKIRAEVLCALAVAFLLLAFALLPFGFRPGREDLSGSATVGNEVSGQQVSGVPFSVVLRDPRFILLWLGYCALPGASTNTTLIRAAELAASRIFVSARGTLTGPEAADSIAGAVRAVVLAFSASNVAGRLAAGSVADLGGPAPRQRDAWHLRLMTCNTALMAVAMTGVAFASDWALIMSVGMVGFSHGSFFAISSTQVSLWFGVDGFPLNLAVLCFGIVVGNLVVSSSLAGVVVNRALRDSWVEISSMGAGSAPSRYCVGFSCFAPTFCFIACMNGTLVLAYLFLHQRMVNASSLYTKD